jgi:hypothetical protein
MADRGVADAGSRDRTCTRTEVPCRLDGGSGGGGGGGAAWDPVKILAGGVVRC